MFSFGRKARASDALEDLGPDVDVTKADPVVQHMEKTVCEYEKTICGPLDKMLKDVKIVHDKAQERPEDAGDVRLHSEQIAAMVGKVQRACCWIEDEIRFFVM